MSDLPIASLRERRLDAAERIMRSWMLSSTHEYARVAAEQVLEAVDGVDPTEGVKERHDAVVALHAGWQYDAWDNSLHCVGCMWERSVDGEDDDQYGVLYAPHVVDELRKVQAL